MFRTRYLILAASLALPGVALAQDPAASGRAAGSTGAAVQIGGELVPVAPLVVGGIAIVGTAVGLSTDSDSASSTATATTGSSTAPSTAAR